MAAEAEVAEKKAAPPKSNMKLFIILGIVAVLVIGGGAGAFLFMGKSGDSQAKTEAEKELAGDHGGGGEEKKAEESGGHGGAAPAEGEKTASGKEVPADTYAFEFPFCVTLADADKHRQLQFEMTIELNDPDLKKTIEERLHKFRDAVITEVSNRVEAEVISREGMDRLKRDVSARFDGMLKPGAVRGVYFSQFLTL